MGVYCVGAILSRRVREGITKKLAFKQRSEGGEGGRQASIWGGVSQEEEAEPRPPRQERSSSVPGSSKGVTSCMNFVGCSEDCGFYSR